jgi:CRISPR-associated protein Cas2
MLRRPVASGYKTMWLFAMFDLPVDTKEAKREYVRFRSMLLDEGFTMMQFSVYSRFCASEELSKKYTKKIKSALPPQGEVRILSITDRQFGKMQVFYGKKRAETEKPPEQMMLF